MEDINFYQWALKCVIIIGVLLPIGVIMRVITSKLILERPINWMKEKNIVKEIFKANAVLGTLFVIEGIISNLALIGIVLFLVGGVIFN